MSDVHNPVIQGIFPSLLWSISTERYNVIDADGHVLEPFSLWEEYMDPILREPRPRMVIDENGKGTPDRRGQTAG